MKQQYHNLPDFYKSLTKKMEFLRGVARRCRVSVYTVRMWCYGDIQTKNEDYLKVLEEESGLTKENLWNYDNKME